MTIYMLYEVVDLNGIDTLAPVRTTESLDEAIGWHGGWRQLADVVHVPSS